jgi:hypothetical protein
MPIDTSRWKREPKPFVCRGINLSLPVDKMGPGKYRALDNVRPYGEGQILGRPGLVQADTFVAAHPVHTIKLLNDPIPRPNQFPNAFNKQVLFKADGTELRSGVVLGAGPPLVNNLVDNGFSGNPLAMSIFKPAFGPRPWMIVADSNKMRITSSNTQPFQYGVCPPNDPPTAAVAGANTNGPDIGTTGVPYVYRYRGRKAGDIQTGAYGNAGPPMRSVDGTGAPIGVSAHQQNVRVTIVTAHPDTSVVFLDVFRFGGSLTTWNYVGSCSNAAGATVTDTFNDLTMAQQPQLEFDNLQPFPTIDQGLFGQCSIAAQAGGGAILTISSSARFKFYDPSNLDQPYYGFGNQIQVGGQAYTFYRAPTSATQVELVENVAGGASGNFLMPSPEIWHQPLTFLWGPYGGGESATFFFGVGDLYRLGALHWTKGNSPESVSEQGVLDVTQPSEPLQNGCLYGGNPFVFSSERQFQIYPTFGQATDFVAIEVPNSKGLYMRWAIAVGPRGIYFRARDGIYVTNGGAPVSITDTDLYSIFPHETGQGQGQQFIADGQDATPYGSGGPFAPPDDTLETAQRLSYGDGFLYYDYTDIDGKQRTLVYNTVTDAWVSRDTYTPPIAMHYAGEGGENLVTGEGIHEMYMGGSDGLAYQYGAADSDNGVAIAGHFRTGTTKGEDPRPRFLWGDAWMDYDSQCMQLTIDIGFDNYTYWSVATLAGLNLNGRRQSVIDINNGEGQYAMNLGLDISFTYLGGRPAFYAWDSSHEPMPELTILRASNWTDDGYPGAKFFQGFYIEGDSLGVTRTVQVMIDGGGILPQTFTFNAGNRQEIPYSFNPPFISRLVRILPADPDMWRLFKIRWIWEPAPDLALNWMTQPTTHNFTEFFHHRDGYFALIASDPVAFTVNRRDDGTSFSYVIPPTTQGALYQQKQYLVLQPMKAKIVDYELTSPVAFRLFQKDTSIRVGPWGRRQGYTVVMPFGDNSRVRGAII